jgi:hypothetical protein
VTGDAAFRHRSQLFIRCGADNAESLLAFIDYE